MYEENQVKSAISNSVKIKMLEEDQKKLVKSNGFLLSELQEKQKENEKIKKDDTKQKLKS